MIAYHVLSNTKKYFLQYLHSKSNWLPPRRQQVSRQRWIWTQAGNKARKWGDGIRFCCPTNIKKNYIHFLVVLGMFFTTWPSESWNIRICQNIFSRHKHVLYLSCKITMKLYQQLTVADNRKPVHQQGRDSWYWGFEFVIFHLEWTRMTR